MAKNYYLILGVSIGASAREIKAAFRRRARELHPDLSGLESGPFLEVQEAYGVLSDPVRRRDYDRQSLGRTRRRPWGPSVEPLVPPRSAPESFRPITRASGFRDLGLDHDFAEYKPSFDELSDRLWGNFEPLERPKAENVESPTVEVVISWRDARFGGRVRVRIPALATCPSCGGHAAIGHYVCWRCGGHGALATEYPIDIAYPPGVRDGHAVRIPSVRHGIENFYRTVLFRVSGG